CDYRSSNSHNETRESAATLTDARTALPAPARRSCGPEHLDVERSRLDPARTLLQRPLLTFHRLHQRELPLRPPQVVTRLRHPEITITVEVIGQVADAEHQRQ